MMRFRKCFLWLGMFFAGFVVAEGELRILAIGDSITHGGIRGREEYTYRLPLQRMLLEREIPFRFVGTRVAGFQRGTAWPEVAEGVPFQPNHPRTDTFDWLHPNPQGQQKMAEAWLSVLMEFLPGASPAP